MDDDGNNVTIDFKIGINNIQWLYVRFYRWRNGSGVVWEWQLPRFWKVERIS